MLAVMFNENMETRTYLLIPKEFQKVLILFM